MSRAWWAACAAMALASVGVFMWGPGWAQSLDWQPQHAWTQPWRWWTAAWVHVNAEHLVANVLGCGVLAYWAQATTTPARWLWAWFAAWPLTHLALGVEPRLLHYGGLSGVLHAGVAVVTCRALWRGQGLQRRLAGAVGVGLLIKLWLEQPGAWPLTVTPPWNFPVVSLAHASGALAGVACAVWMALWERRRRP